MSLNNFCYEYTLNSLDPYSYRVTYMPQSLKRLLNTPVIVQGCVTNVVELLFNTDSRFFYIDSIYENMYDCHSDDASWVEGVLQEIEELRLGKEIEDMENILEREEIHVDETKDSENIEELIDETESNNFLDINNNLASAEYGKEIFIPQKHGENWILIHAFENRVERFFYDSIFRCYKKEEWEIKRDESEKILKTTTTNFRISSYIPLSRTITTENSITECVYNENGYLVKEEKYALLEEEKYITSKLSLKYDNDNRVTESIVVEYKYTDDKFSKLDYSFNKKYVYKYNKDDIPPNLDYYENDILKIRTVYTTKTDYISEVFFDEGFSVKSIYKDSKIQKEIFTINGKEERIKDYE